MRQFLGGFLMHHQIINILFTQINDQAIELSFGVWVIQYVLGSPSSELAICSSSPGIEGALSAPFLRPGVTLKIFVIIFWISKIFDKCVSFWSPTVPRSMRGYQCKMKSKIYFQIILTSYREWTNQFELFLWTFPKK